MMRGFDLQNKVSLESLKKYVPEETFFRRYLEMCCNKNTTPLTELRFKNGVLTVLDFHGDKLNVTDWHMFVNALLQDKLLKKLVLRMRRPGLAVFNDIDTEKKAAGFKKDAVLCTKFVLERVVEAIAKTIADSEILEVIGIEGVPLGEVYIKPIATAITTSKLKEISFDRSLLRDVGVQTVCIAIRASKSLEKLSLASCGMTKEGVVHVAQLIKLREIERLAEVWQNSLRYRENDPTESCGLRSVNISGNPSIGDDGLKLLMDVLKEDCFVKELLMEDCGISNEGGYYIIDCLNYNDALRVFKLDNNKAFSRKAITNIAEYLKQRGDKRLHHITEEEIAKLKEEAAVAKQRCDSRKERVQLDKKLRLRFEELIENLWKQAGLKNKEPETPTMSSSEIGYTRSLATGRTLTSDANTLTDAQSQETKYTHDSDYIDGQVYQSQLENFESQKSEYTADFIDGGDTSSRLVYHIENHYQPASEEEQRQEDEFYDSESIMDNNRLTFPENLETSDINESSLSQISPQDIEHTSRNSDYVLEENIGHYYDESDGAKETPWLNNPLVPMKIRSVLSRQNSTDVSIQDEQHNEIEHDQHRVESQHTVRASNRPLLTSKGFRQVGGKDQTHSRRMHKRQTAQPEQKSLPVTKEACSISSSPSDPTQSSSSDKSRSGSVLMYQAQQPPKNPVTMSKGLGSISTSPSDQTQSSSSDKSRSGSVLMHQAQRPQKNQLSIAKGVRPVSKISSDQMQCSSPTFMQQPHQSQRNRLHVAKGVCSSSTDQSDPAQCSSYDKPRSRPVHMHQKHQPQQSRSRPMNLPQNRLPMTGVHSVIVTQKEQTPSIDNGQSDPHPMTGVRAVIITKKKQISSIDSGESHPHSKCDAKKPKQNCSSAVQDTSMIQEQPRSTLTYCNAERILEYERTTNHGQRARRSTNEEKRPNYVANDQIDHNTLQTNEKLKKLQKHALSSNDAMPRPYVPYKMIPTSCEHIHRQYPLQEDEQQQFKPLERSTADTLAIPYDGINRQYNYEQCEEGYKIPIRYSQQYATQYNPEEGHHVRKIKSDQKRVDATCKKRASRSNHEAANAIDYQMEAVTYVERNIGDFKDIPTRPHVPESGERIKHLHQETKRRQKKTMHSNEQSNFIDNTKIETVMNSPRGSGGPNHIPRSDSLEQTKPDAAPRRTHKRDNIDYQMDEVTYVERNIGDFKDILTRLYVPESGERIKHLRQETKRRQKKTMHSNEQSNFIDYTKIETVMDSPRGSGGPNHIPRSDSLEQTKPDAAPRRTHKRDNIDYQMDEVTYVERNIGDFKDIPTRLYVPESGERIKHLHQETKRRQKKTMHSNEQSNFIDYTKIETVMDSPRGSGGPNHIPRSDSLEQTKLDAAPRRTHKRDNIDYQMDEVTYVERNIGDFKDIPTRLYVPESGERIKHLHQETKRRQKKTMHSNEQSNFIDYTKIETVMNSPRESGRPSHIPRSDSLEQTEPDASPRRTDKRDNIDYQMDEVTYVERNIGDFKDITTRLYVPESGERIKHLHQETKRRQKKTMHSNEQPNFTDYTKIETVMNSPRESGRPNHIPRSDTLEQTEPDAAPRRTHKREIKNVAGNAHFIQELEKGNTSCYSGKNVILTGADALRFNKEVFINNRIKDTPSPANVRKDSESDQTEYYSATAFNASQHKMKTPPATGSKSIQVEGDFHSAKGIRNEQYDAFSSYKKKTHVENISSLPAPMIDSFSKPATNVNEASATNSKHKKKRGYNNIFQEQGQGVATSAATAVYKRNTKAPRSHHNN